MQALYSVSDPRDRALQAFNQKADAYKSMMPDIDSTPGKTAGGAISNAMGGGMTGYMMAGMAKGGMGGPAGAAWGTGFGLLAYLLS